MKKYLEVLKKWLIEKLGGAYLSELDLEKLLYAKFDKELRAAVEKSCMKVKTDPSWTNHIGASLGRNALRDEACEWAKLYLKDMGIEYKDSDIHLACELCYRSLR